MNTDSPHFTRIETRPTRPAWLADAAVPDVLVDLIHAHADAAGPVVEAVLNWASTAHGLLKELDGYVRASGLGELDDIDYRIGWWTGSNRLDVAGRLLELAGESVAGLEPLDDDKLAEKMGELRFGQ